MKKKEENPQDLAPECSRAIRESKAISLGAVPALSNYNCHSSVPSGETPLKVHVKYNFYCLPITPIYLKLVARTKIIQRGTEIAFVSGIHREIRIASF